MIMVIGEYYNVINEEGSSLSGIGYEVSKEISKNKCSIMFVTRISRDDIGLQLLDSLVEKEIIFDPFLCNSELVSPRINSKIDSKYNLNNEREDSVLIPFSESELVEVFQQQDDINVIHYSLLPTVKNEKYLDLMVAIDTIELKPIKYFNLADNNDISIPYDKGVFDSLTKFADIVQVNREYIKQYSQSLSIEQSLYKFKNDFKKASILYFDDKTIQYSSALNCGNSFTLVKEFSSNKKNINTLIAATFLSYLHNHDYFGTDMDAPIFKESPGSIDKALESIKLVLESD
ncbi:MAG: hypothetical protein JJE21_01400 [Spirochaetaceae bacterium]|nr:hypothetical protein [Spirochaetaceae bacterium]